MRQMCSFFPGSSWFCELPADKDTAILPFDVAAETPEDEALAKGLLSFLHSGLYDLYPDKGAMCLHIRGGTRSANAYGTNLTLSGRIEVADGSIRLASRLEEPPDLGADPAAAKRLLRAAETESPESKIADLVERAMLKTAQDLELQFAVERWDAWRARVPDEPAALLAHFRGLGFLDEGESTVGQEAVPVLLRAAEQFNLAIDERYAFAWAHYGLGEAYRLLFERSGDSTWASRARNAYQEAAGLDPDSASVRKGLAELAADQGDARAAVEGLAEANRMNPFDHDIQIAYAGALESVGQISRTEQVWAQALELRPNCWYGYNEIARFYLDHGRHEEAARALQTIVRLAPDHAAAHHNLAFVYIKIGRYDDAIERAADSVKLGIGPLGYSTLGRGYLAKGCTEDALLNLQHAVREAERIEEQTGEPYATRYLFWKNQGDGLVVAGRDGEAREAFTQTVNFSLEFLAERPRHRVAAAYLALALAHLGRKNEALAAVEEALSIAPQNEETLLHAATAYELVGERKLALSLLESAFAHGLYLHEVRHTSGLEEVRRDRRYLEMVARLGLDANSTADSTTIVAITGCPQRAEAGRGLRN